MAKFLNKDPAAYLIEKERFISEVKQFHDSKGTPFRNVPTIGGREIDLYLLYWLVTAQGGWERVNSRSTWEDLLTCFDIDESTLNAALGLKQVYLRHLEPYEKIHFQGEEEDREDDLYYDEEDSRTRRQKAQKIQATVPVTYNHNQHNISDEVRANYGLSQNLYKKSDYDRLALSLLSPLPNEQDFAINVCTLLSNEGKHTLKLAKCPRLLDLLLAHAGVHQHGNLKDYLNESYKESRNYDLMTFWSDVCRDDSMRELLLHPPTEGALSAFFNVSTKNSGGKESNSTSKALSLRTTQDRLNSVRREAAEELSRRCGEEDEFFSVGRQCGTRELAGQRVLQIATIVRNLSFEDDNMPILARSLTCLRFCLLCASSKWNNLNQMGFDILSNIAADMTLVDTSTDSCVTEVLLSTLTTTISSVDRFQIISSLDVLNKLCQVEANEAFIANLMSDNPAIYDQLVAYLSLHDIHLLIATLECIYALSCHGEISCNAIARTHGAVESLVSLVTVEAQSYGPKACILMRVVETVPGSNSTAVHATAPPQVHQLQALAAPTSTPQMMQQTVIHQSPAVIKPAINGLKPDQLAQLGQLTPIRPPQDQHQLVNVVPQQQQQQQQQIITTTVPTMMGQQNMIRGQMVQIQTTGQQSATGLQLQRQPMTVIRPGQTTIQHQLPTTTTTMVMPQQQQLVQQTQMSGGSIIIANASGTSTTVYRPQQQQPQQQNILLQQLQSQQPQQQQQNVLQQQIRPTAVNVQSPIRPPMQQQQQQPQQIQQQQQLQQGPPAGSQQVQLRVSNDDANRQFCLSWLKATYELAAGTSIEQQVMYKQYLASLHKLGKREVISAQHYAVCVRTLFGGSVGPNRRTMPDGTVQNHYDGVKVRQTPLPLRFAGPRPDQQQQQQQQQSFVVNSTTGAPPNPPGSPILTNLLHRKSPAPDTLNIQVKEEESVLDGILPKDFAKGDGMLANLLEKKPGQQHMVNGVGQQQQQQKVIMINQQQQHQLVNGAGGIKRPSSVEPNGDGHQMAKRPMLDCNGMTNGPQAENDGHIIKADVNLGQTAFVNNTQQQQQLPVQQQQQLVLAAGQKIVTGSDGKQYIVKTGPPGTGNGTIVGTLNPQMLTQQQPQQQLNGSTGVVQQQPQQQQQLVYANAQGGKTIIILQPQAKVLTSTGQQVLVQNPGQPQPLMVQSSTGQQMMVQASGQPIMMQNSSMAGQQTVLMQNPATGQQQQVIMHNNSAAANAVGQTVIRTVGGQTMVQQPQPVNPTGLTFTTRPPAQVVAAAASPANVIQRPPQPQQQVPLPAGLVRVAAPAGLVASPSQPQTNPLVQQQPQQVPSTLTPSPAAATPGLVVTPTPAAPLPPSVPIPKPDPAAPFLCEWHGCMKAFKSPKEVERHAIVTHCPVGSDDIPCLWLRCDGMRRKRFSLMTHLQDRHCHPQLMKLMAVRRVQMATSGKSDVPLPPAPPPHPGYAPNAALHAIKRHAQEFINPKALAMGDEKEGPVTKSIRLTSALILKNLVLYSPIGKKRLRAYESHLSTIALSNVESSRTVSQILFELSDVEDSNNSN